MPSSIVIFLVWAALAAIITYFLVGFIRVGAGDTLDITKILVHTQPCPDCQKHAVHLLFFSSEGSRRVCLRCGAEWRNGYKAPEVEAIDRLAAVGSAKLLWRRLEAQGD